MRSYMRSRPDGPNRRDHESWLCEQLSSTREQYDGTRSPTEDYSLMDHVHYLASSRLVCHLCICVDLDDISSYFVEKTEILHLNLGPRKASAR